MGMNPGPICPGIRTDGEPCKAVVWKRYPEEGLCLFHHKRKHGVPLPSQMRRKNEPTPVTELLHKFGINRSEIDALRKVFPDIDDMLFGSKTIQQDMHALVKVMSLKLMATSDRDTAACIVMLGKFLEKMNLNHKTDNPADRVKEVDLF